MKYAVFYSFVLLVILLKITIAPLYKDVTFGSAHNPIRIALVPSQEAGKIIHSADKLTSYLSERTGYSFASAMPANYIAAVEAFGNKKADIAFLNTFSYVLANQKYGADAVLKIIRRNGDTTYGGQFLTYAGSGLQSMYDLHGKRLAFVDPASASGYILPKAMLQKLGVKPSQEVFAQRHDNVVMMIYQRQVDAGAAYYSRPDQVTGELQDARALVIKQYPDVANKVINIGYTETIANDPIMFRAGFPAGMKKKIIQALLDFQHVPGGKAALADIYGIEGLLPCRNEDYDALRRMLKEQGMDVEELVRKTKK